jgi:hypothetical protein
LHSLHLSIGDRYFGVGYWRAGYAILLFAVVGITAFEADYLPGIAIAKPVKQACISRVKVTFTAVAALYFVLK